MHAIVIAAAPAADLRAYHALIRNADLIIVADGGAQHMAALALLPHVVIGDLDSISAAMLAQLRDSGVAIEQHSPVKDETDLELALLLAHERGATRISILAALGGRPDMHFANHLLLALPALRGCDVALLEAGWSVRLLRDTMTIHAPPGTRVSLVPLGNVEGVTTEGLRYPLRDEPLLLGPARGVSNEIIDQTARITVRQGFVFVFVEEIALVAR